MNTLIIVLYLLFSIIAFGGIFFVISVALTDDLEITKMIFKQEINYFFHKKKRDERTEFAYEFLNTMFKNYISNIVSSKDEDISNDFEIGLTEAKKLKSFAKDISKNNSIVFIEKEEIEEILKENSVNNIFNSISNSLKIFSKKEFVEIYKLAKQAEKTNVNNVEDATKILSKIFKGTRINERSIKILNLTIDTMNKKKRSTQNKNDLQMNDSYLQTFFSGIFNGKAMNKLNKYLALENSYV